ncbi:MAG: hypothetical protein WC668_04960 [Patescibacteria group bacterium]|jgi:hypothetical protein
MKTKKSKAELAESFVELYALEKQALNLYDEFLESLADPFERDAVLLIRDQEIEHMSVAGQLSQLIN